MKRILFLLLILKNNLKSESNQENKSKPDQIKKTEDNTHIILARIASFITFFSNIIANPNDSKNVATSILGMISTIFTLAADTRSLTKNQIYDLNLDTNRIENILNNKNIEDIEMLQDIVKKYCDLQIKILESFKKKSEFIYWDTTTSTLS